MPSSLVSYPLHSCVELGLAVADVAFYLQEGDKSIGQKASDAMGGTAKPGEKGYVEQAQDAIGTGVKYVQDTANGMSNPSTLYQQ